MRGKLFLGGGGDTEQSKALDIELGTLFEGTRKPTCLYIPVAMDESKHSSAKEWFTNNYDNVCCRIEMLGRLTDLDPKESFDVIYIGGGNTGKLLDRIYDSGFDQYLFRHLAAGRVVYGGSAGAIVLGRTILTAPTTEHSSTSNDGLDLLGSKAVVAHYNDAADQERVRELCLQLECTLLAIPEDAGVVVTGEELKAVGSTDVVIFEPGEQAHSL
jgi:dipeptidase E